MLVLPRCPCGRRLLAAVVMVVRRRCLHPCKPGSAPLASSAVITTIRCPSDRPSRSSRHTTSVSPGRRCSRTASSCGRRSSAPDARSVQTFQHPAAASSTTCRSGFYSVVDTRAWPSRCAMLPDRTANGRDSLGAIRRFRTPVVQLDRPPQHAHQRLRHGDQWRGHVPDHNRAIAGRRRVARTRSSVHSVQHAERPTPARA